MAWQAFRRNQRVPSRHTHMWTTKLSCFRPCAGSALSNRRCRTLLYVPHAAPTHAFASPLPLDGLRQPDVLLLGPDMLQHAKQQQQQQQQGQPQQQQQQRQPEEEEEKDADVGHEQGGGQGRPGEGENAPPAALPPPPLPRHPPLHRIKELVLRAAVAGGVALLPVHATGRCGLTACSPGHTE